MPVSKRQQIVDAIDARLKTITTANGYNTDAGNNVFEWRSYPLDENSELPALVYRDTEEIESLAVGGYQLHTLTIEIEGYVVGANAARDLRALIADVIKAIGTDLTWGGLAEDTRPVEESIEIDQEERKIAGAVIRIEIDYRTQAFDPYN